MNAHLNEVLVKVGDKITRGDKIALVGSTGNSTGSHLHYEIKKDDTYIDPLSFISIT